MSRKRKKIQPRRSPAKGNNKRSGLGEKTNRPARLLAFLAGSGVLLVVLTGAYQYFAGNVSLEYVQAVGRAYEFELRNDTPSDKKIVYFRVDPPTNQQVVYETTRDIYARVGSDGQVTLPGGNVSYVPAAEFEELDGQKLDANSSIKFRIPPLSSQPWMEPNATIVDVRYQLESENILLLGLERTLAIFSFRPREYSMRYLVIDNYWTSSRSESLDEAIRVYCRENSEAATTNICNEKR